MANIDVTELFGDSDFVDEMKLITRRPLVNSLGENMISESIAESFGSIQPASGKTLERIPEALRSANVSSFWFKGPIATVEDCRYPSLLEFRGRRFQIQTVFDWTNWGQGWSEGVCVAEKPA